MSKSRLEEDAEPAECEQLFALAQALRERPPDFTQLHNDRGKCNINHKYSREKACVHPFHMTKGKKKKSLLPSPLLPPYLFHNNSTIGLLKANKGLGKLNGRKEKFTKFKWDTDKLMNTTCHCNNCIQGRSSRAKLILFKIAAAVYLVKHQYNSA